MINRRQFVNSAMGSAAVLAFAEELLASSTQTSDSAVANKSVLKFWTQEIKQPYNDFKNGQSPKAGPSYQPAFAFYSGPGVFLAPQEIKTDDLPEKGQVGVSIRVERYRPSEASKALFANVQSGSLRVDVKQTAPLPSLQEALAWTAVAGLVPKQKNPFTDLGNLKFDTGTAWGQLQQVPLSNGLGFWAWNFFLKRKESVWGKIMDIFRTLDKAAPLFFPVLGLPAIALTALNAVDKLVGYLQAEGDSNWLIKSVDSPVFATKEGMSTIGQGLPLKTGHYLVIPQEQLGTFGGARKGLDLKDGYLVPTGTDPFGVPEAATHQITAVDYLSLYVQVKPPAEH